MTAARSERAGSWWGAEVLVEVLFVDGCLFLVVSNVGDRPALDVRVTFEPPLRGLGGKCEVSALAVFRRLAFLGPGREITVLLDTAPAWFARDEPTEFRAEAVWLDEERGQGRREVRHDLSVYRDLPHVPGLTC